MKGTALGLPPANVIGRRLEHLAQTASTQGDARALLEGGAPHGTVVWADRQTAGRGRGGRAWVSPSEALFCSVVLRPAMPIAQATQLTSLACVGLLDGLGGMGLVPAIKWPNDVVFPSDTVGPLGPFKKAGGILVELVTRSADDWGAILGFGLNLSAPAAGWPPLLAPRATDLRTEGFTGTREQALGSVLEGLEGWLAVPEAGGLFGHALVRLRAASATLGRRIEIPEEGVCGEATGLADDGGLLVTLDDGEVKKVLAGDVYEPGAVAEGG